MADRSVRLIEAAAFALSVCLAVGCVPEEGAPPLFNAIDPSLQCPAGQVGWDFTTGGNETDIVVQPVGNEIKIQEIKYWCADQPLATATDLTASYRAECDNAVKCERPIVRAADSVSLSCAKRHLRARYKCGNEPTVYDLSRIHWPEYTYNQSVLTPTNTGPDDKVLFACGDVINMKGVSFLLQDNTYSTIQNNRVGQCNGRRRCYSNAISDLSGSGTVRPTKYYYTCGKSTVVREASAELRVKPVDFSCVDDVEQLGTEREAAVYFKDLTYKSHGHGGIDNPALVASLTASLKTACEGKRSCKVPVTAAQLVNMYGIFSVEYWCGSSRGITEKKFYNVSDLAGRSYRGAEEISLQCGGRLKIVDSSEAWARTACPDGVRVCSLPEGAPDTRLNFFCEGTTGAVTTTKWLRDSYRASYSNPVDRSLECPLESAATGIELVSLHGSAPLVEHMSACNNRNSCLIRHIGNNPDWNYYDYKCSGTNENKRSVVHTINGVRMLYLDCQPKPRVTEISGCVTPPSSALTCKSVPSAGCSVDLVGGAVTASTVRACTTDINIKYRCGSDPAILTRAIPPGSFPASASPDGGALTADGGSAFEATVECPYDPTPRATPSSKRCIAATCPPNTRRNAEMVCESDANIVVYQQLNLDVVFENLSWAPVTDLKEGFPYIKYIRASYSGTPDLNRSQAGTIWAYDVFKRKDNTGPEINGFRCIVSSPSLNHGGGGSAILGDWQSYEASTLPNDCYKVAPYGDITGSWYHGSRKAGVNEQVFRNTYNLVKTIVVPAFDSKGRAVVASRNAPNPVGFFYKPDTGYVDQFDYLAQQSDFRLKREYRFLPSTQIELETVSGKLDQSQLELNATSAAKPPVLDLNFNWRMLGDSPFHPQSPNTRVAANVRSLRHLNLRATVEIAKEDFSLPNKWVAANSAIVAAVPISDGNAQEKIERLTVPLTADIVKRIMSVKGPGATQRADGWMTNNIEINSVFKARVCVDFDGLSRPPGETDLNDKYVSTTIGAQTYRLGVTTRCTPEFPFTVTRDLFAKPVLVLNSNERPNDKANTKAQGGDRVASTNDQANQSACRKSCRSNNDCGGGVCDRFTGADGGVLAMGVCAPTDDNTSCTTDFRSNMTSGGSSGFGRSIMSARSSGSSTTATRTSTGSASNNVSLMSYNIVNDMSSEAGQLITGTTKRELKISLGRIWSSVASVGATMKALQTQANPKPVKPWWKPGFSKPYGKDPQPCIAFGISAGGFIFAGVATLQVEISASVSLGFDIALKFVTDNQTVANMNNPAYPCLGTGKCLQLSSMEKTFTEANEDCNYKGGKLAEVRTAADLTALRTAAGTQEIWIGAQAAHLFTDPSCTDFSTVTSAGAQARLDTCKANSVTRYQWITQNVALADSQPSGVLYNTGLHLANHGFGTGLTSISNTAASPLKSGVLLTGTGALEAHRVTNELRPGVTVGAAPKKAKYVCEYESAARYALSEVSLSPGIEFSAGVGASVCWPTSIIGVCLAAEFKFITAGISIETGSKTIKIYSTTTGIVPRATLTSRGTTAKAEAAFLTGALSVEVRFFIGSKNFDIARYTGIAKYEEELWTDVERSRR